MAGYAMLLIGNVTVATGIGHYFGDILQGDSRKVLSIVSLLSFCLIVGLLEGGYRLRNKYSKGHLKPTIPTKDGKVEEYTPDKID